MFGDVVSGYQPAGIGAGAGLATVGISIGAAGVTASTCGASSGTTGASGRYGGGSPISDMPESYRRTPSHVYAPEKGYAGICLGGNGLRNG